MARRIAKLSFEKGLALAERFRSAGLTAAQGEELLTNDDLLKRCMEILPQPATTSEDHCDASPAHEVVSKFKISVNPARSVANLIKRGAYKSVDERIDDEMFSADTGSHRRVVIKVVRFNRGLSTAGVVSILDSIALRPATIQEILAIGFKRLDWKTLGSRTIFGLGSSVLICGQEYAPVIGNDSRGRVLRLGLSQRTKWTRFDAFAAVPQ